MLALYATLMQNLGNKLGQFVSVSARVKGCVRVKLVVSLLTVTTNCSRDFTADCKRTVCDTYILDKLFRIT